MVKITLFLVATTALFVGASEPSPEQLQMMREYHLSVPPVLLDKDGKDKSLKIQKKEILPDIAAGVVVKTSDEGRQIEVVFEPWGQSELPLQKKVMAEIIDPTPAVKPVLKIAPDSVKSVKTIFESDFDKSVDSGVVVVDCFRPDCGGCIIMDPIMTDISLEIQDVKFVKIDKRFAPAAASKMSVYELPRFTIYVNGQIVASRIGATSKAEMKYWIVQNSGMTNRPPLPRATAQQQIKSGPTEEQLKIMREYHLSVPPIILSR